MKKHGNQVIGQQREKDALPVFEEYLTVFGKHAILSKIPCIVDGLKPVQRRILMANRQFEGASPLPKAVSVTGVTVSMYHPHSDASISSTAIRMAQPHLNIVTLMESPSNVGDYGGGEPAAPRYFEIKASDLCNFSFFDGVDLSMFPHELSEIGNGVLEPVFLVPKIPLALIVSGAGIGFGHSSEPGNLNLYAVLHMVKVYAKLNQNGGAKILDGPLQKKIAEDCVPDFPTYQYIRNWYSLIESNAKGEYTESIIVEGLLELTPTQIIVKNLPTGISPKEVWTKLGEELRSNKPNFVNTNLTRIEDYSKGPKQCRIELTVKRGVDVFSILEEVKKQIGFTKRITPRYLFTTPNGFATYADPLKMLKTWYELRVTCIRGEVRSQQNKLTREIRVLEALLIIGKDIVKVVNMLVKAKDSESAIVELCKKFGISRTQAYAIMNFKLGDLPKKSREELIAKRDITVKKLDELHTRHLNPHKAVEADADQALKFKQYANRISLPDQSIGYLTTPTGWMQFDTLEELEYLVNTFSDYTDIVLYTQERRRTPVLQSIGKKDTLVTLPKQMQYTQFYAELEGKYTVVWSVTGKVGKVHGRVLPNNKTVRGTFVGNNVLIVTNEGELKQISTNDIPTTQSIERPVGDGVIFASPVLKDDVMVALSNRTNEVEIVKAKVGQTLQLTSKATILAIGGLDDPLSIPVMGRCLDKCVIRHIVLNNPVTTTIKLNQRKFTKPWKHVGSILIQG